MTAVALPAGALRGGRLLTAGAGAVAASAGALAMSLGTGVLLARSLGPAGRGETAALLAAPQVVGWLFLLGSTQTVSYFRAREPEHAPALLGTWLALTLPLGLAAIAAGELLAPVLLGAQTDATLALARLFLLTAALTLVTETTLGFVLGAEHFALFNVLKVASPALVAAAYALAWATGHLTVAFAVWANAAATALLIAGTLVFLIRRHGIARPDAALARRTAWYGVKAHSTNVSFLLTARLDLLLLPAFVGAHAVGLYSVATNVSWIVFALAGSIASIALPIAARQGRAGGAADTIARSLRATLAVAVVLAALIAVLAPVAVRAVFGPEFAGAVVPLRILLPGSVLYAAALVLVSGLYAANRPFTAACVQGIGLVTTVIGLLAFLRAGGIVAAAWVSTASYLTVFVFALIAHRHRHRKESLPA
jgi:O-antigen/teichoic acid export membrane protein